MEQPLLEMCGISKQFPGVKALDGLSLDVRAGEVHALVGENGAGKSTLIKVLYGIYKPDAGEIRIQGKKVNIEDPAHAGKLGIGVVFQELNVCPHLDVANNIFLGRMKNRHGVINDRWAVEKAREILQQMLKMDINPQRLVAHLSIAEQQMIEIAKVISQDCKIVVFDEPTSSLTNNEIDHLFEIITQLKKRGVGIIYISHRLEELDRIADRVTVLRDGKHIKTMCYAQTTKEELVSLMVGRQMEGQFPQDKRAIGETVFCARGIRNEKVDVKEISVRAGEIVGISGLVGSGRTETMRALFGADKADIAELEICGKAHKPFQSTRQAIQAGLVYVTEDRKKDGLALGLSIQENINIASLEKLSRHGVMREKQARHNARCFVESLSIKTPTTDKQTKFLSGGNQQKVILAKWLSCGMKVLIFDEPTRGIDVGAKYEIYKLMNRLSAQGVGIIMISSELPEIIGMSDRVLVFRGGRVAAELQCEEIDAETIMQYATGVKQEKEKCIV